VLVRLAVFDHRPGHEEDPALAAQPDAVFGVVVLEEETPARQPGAARCVGLDQQPDEGGHIDR
jgi:hypothetical protein